MGGASRLWSPSLFSIAPQCRFLVGALPTLAHARGPGSHPPLKECHSAAMFSAPLGIPAVCDAMLRAA